MKVLTSRTNAAKEIVVKTKETFSKFICGDILGVSAGMLIREKYDPNQPTSNQKCLNKAPTLLTTPTQDVYNLVLAKITMWVHNGAPHSYFRCPGVPVDGFRLATDPTDHCNLGTRHDHMSLILRSPSYQQ